MSQQEAKEAKKELLMRIQREHGFDVAREVDAALGADESLTLTRAVGAVEVLHRSKTSSAWAAVLTAFSVFFALMSWVVIGLLTEGLGLALFPWSLPLLIAIGLSILLGVLSSEWRGPVVLTTIVVGSLALVAAVVFAAKYFSGQQARSEVRATLDTRVGDRITDARWSANSLGASGGSNRKAYFNWLGSALCNSTGSRALSDTLQTIATCASALDEANKADGGTDRSLTEGALRCDDSQINLMLRGLQAQLRSCLLYEARPAPDPRR